jgi:phosphonate transport system substrate-binding protein
MARLRPVALSALLVAALVWPPARAAAAEFTLGIVPQYEQRKLFEIWRPIADELERRTGHRFKLETTLGVREFEKEFMRGGFDFVYMNPYFVGKFARGLGYEPLVRDRALVRGVVVVRKGGPLRTPKDVSEKAVAFPTPNALAGCMLMKAELKAQFGVNVHPVYVTTVSNVLLHVAKGMVDAGGVPDKTLPLADPAVRERLEILHTTRAIPGHPLAAHPRVPAEVREQVRAAMLALAATAEGKALLLRVPIKELAPATLAEYAFLGTLGLEEWFDPTSSGD